MNGFDGFGLDQSQENDWDGMAKRFVPVLAFLSETSGSDWHQPLQVDLNGKLSHEEKKALLVKRQVDLALWAKWIPDFGTHLLFIQKPV